MAEVLLQLQTMLWPTFPLLRPGKQKPPFHNNHMNEWSLFNTMDEIVFTNINNKKVLQRGRWRRTACALQAFSTGAATKGGYRLVRISSTRSLLGGYPLEQISSTRCHYKGGYPLVWISSTMCHYQGVPPWCIEGVPTCEQIHKLKTLPSPHSVCGR